MRSIRMGSVVLTSVAVATGLMGATCDGKSSQATRPPLTVVALTDFHGALQPESVATATGENIEVGGAALLSTYVNAIRNKAPGPVVVIDAGDLFQGTMESNLPEGAPVIRFYNYLEVDAAALGNHEFDFGPAGEKSIPMNDSDDPRGALKERVREARFPFLATNVVDETGQTPEWLKKSVVVQRGGYKIGVVGAATPSTPSTTVRANLKGLRFLQAVGLVKAEAERLRREEKVDVVILTIHDGGGCRDNTNPDDLSSCEDGDLFKIIRALPSGLIDVAVGGHTHKGMAKRIGKTAILQSFSRGKYVGTAVLTPDDKKSHARIGGLIPVCGAAVQSDKGPSCDANVVAKSQGPVFPAEFLGAEVAPDAQVLTLLKPDFDKVREIKEAPLGIRVLDTLTGSYGGESALGNLVADVLKQETPGVEIGVSNGGGLRAPLKPGPLTYGDVFEVLPFDNRAAVITLDGETLKKMVEIGHAGGHGALTWSGLAFTARDCAVTAITVGGLPLEPSRVYRIATNDYLAGGGSGFDRLKLKEEQIEVLWNGPYILRDMTAQWLKRAKRDIKAKDFHDRSAPRQNVTGHCQ